MYAQEHRDIRLLPDEADVAIAFVVDDIPEAIAEVLGAALLVAQATLPPSSHRRISDLRPFGLRRNDPN